MEGLSRHKHTRNVIYRATMQNGLDFKAIAEALHAAGLLPKGKELETTIRAGEVIGAVSKPIPFKWKMVKWFQEDHPAAMVIDGVKYRWTERGTLARVPAGRR